MDKSVVGLEKREKRFCKLNQRLRPTKTPSNYWNNFNNIPTFNIPVYWNPRYYYDNIDYNTFFSYSDYQVLARMDRSEGEHWGVLIRTKILFHNIYCFAIFSVTLDLLFYFPIMILCYASLLFTFNLFLQYTELMSQEFKPLL